MIVRGLVMVIEQDVDNFEEVKLNKIYRTHLFTKIYATNIKAYQTDVDIRIELLNEKRETENELIFYSDGLAMLTLEAAKKLSIELHKLIEQHEAKYGEIKLTGDRKCNSFVDD